jgi:hypothetical protein
MRRYLQTKISGILHLGATVYDKDEGDFDPPEATLCGIETSGWGSRFVKTQTWGAHRPEDVCPTCDRTALWQSIDSLGIA